MLSSLLAIMRDQDSLARTLRHLASAARRQQQETASEEEEESSAEEMLLKSE